MQPGVWSSLPNVNCRQKESSTCKASRQLYSLCDLHSDRLRLDTTSSQISTHPHRITDGNVHTISHWGTTSWATMAWLESSTVCHTNAALLPLKSFSTCHVFLPQDLLLHVEPSNRQAQSLKELVDSAETKEGYIGPYIQSVCGSMGHPIDQTTVCVSYWDRYRTRSWSRRIGDITRCWSCQASEKVIVDE